MKTRWLLPLTTLPAAALLILAVSCTLTDRSAKSWSLSQPVSIAGGEGEAWMNLFSSWGVWQSLSVDGGTAGLLLRDGDLIGGKAATVYRASDGPALKPTSNKWSMHLAGKVVSVSLESGTEGREWLEKAPAQDLAAIRFLTLPDDPDATLLPTLKRLAAVNPSVALVVQSSAMLKQVLPLFRPHVLILGAGALDAEARKIMADQQQVETLFVSGDTPGSLDFLPMLHGLRRLIVNGWDVAKAGPLPAGLHNLRSIVVVGSTTKDLAALDAAPAGLDELSLLGFDDLADVRALAKWPGLKMLILSGSKKVLELPNLAGLTQLRWAGLPPETTQEQFVAFIAAHRDLKILELAGCEKVTDLAPLRELRELQGLILNGPYQHLEVVRDLKSLRFVGLHKDVFKKSPDQIAEIRKALPDALVVPVSGLCLGSGWILLLIPAVAAARLLAWRRPATTGPRHA
jgi:hypothetical protein